MEDKDNNKFNSQNINDKNLNDDIFKKIENIYPAKEMEGFRSKVIFKKSSNKKNTVFEPKSLITDSNYISDGGLNTKLKKYNSNNSYIKSNTFNKPLNNINNSKEMNLTQRNSNMSESIEKKSGSKDLNKKILLLQKNIKNKSISSKKPNNYYDKRKNYDINQPKLKKEEEKNEKINNEIENKEKKIEELIYNNRYVHDLQNKEKNNENNKEYKNIEKKIKVLEQNNYNIDNLLKNEEEEDDNNDNKNEIMNSYPNKKNNILSQSYNFKNKIPLSSKKNFYKSKSNKSEEKKDYNENLSSKIFKPHVNTLEYLENIYKETESNNYQSKNLLTDSNIIKNKKLNRKNKNKLLVSDNNDEDFKKRINKKIIKNFMKRKRNEIKINSVKEKVNKKEININKYINLRKLEDNINLFRKENFKNKNNISYSIGSKKNDRITKNNYYIGNNNSHNKPITPKNNNKYYNINFKFNNDNNILENTKKTLQLSQNLYSKNNIDELLKDSFRTSLKNNKLENKKIRNNNRYNNNF